MAASFVKNVGSTTFSMATTASVTVPAAGVASGDLLVVEYVVNSGATAPSISDTKGNTWTKRINDIGADPYLTVWESFISIALVSGNTITVSFSSTTGAFGVEQFSGVATYDAQNSGTGSGTALASGTISPAGVGLIVGVGAWGNTRVRTEDTDTNGGSGWTSLTQLSPSSGRYAAPAYKVTTSAATQGYDPTLNTTAGWAAVVIAYNETASGSVPKSSPMPQLLSH